MDISIDLGAGAHLVIRGVDEDGTVRNADVELIDPESGRWSATVLTHQEVARLMDAWQSTGECQAGAFLRVPDLIVVRDAGTSAVVDVFTKMYRSGEHRAEMTAIPGADAETRLHP